MGKNLGGFSTFFVIIALTIGSFLLWLVVLVVVWAILHGEGSTTSFWEITASLSTAIAAAGVLGAGYVAYRELSEISSGRHIEVADKLFAELNSPENIDSRRWIYENLTDNPAQDLKTMTEEGQAHIKRVLNSLDRVAFLTQSGWIPDDIIMPWMHPMIYKSWLKLEPFIQYERKRRNEPYFYRYAGDLAERCHRWRVKHVENAAIEWVENAL